MTLRRQQILNYLRKMVGKGALFTVMVLWISHASQKTEKHPIPKH